jgi:hypothetical protein
MSRAKSFLSLSEGVIVSVRYDVRSVLYVEVFK